jgi:hypothetical protein
MRAENKGPIRKVVSIDEMPVDRKGRRIRCTWFLECGHKVYHKGSVPIAKRTHCRDCREGIEEVQVKE